MVYQVNVATSRDFEPPSRTAHLILRHAQAKPMAPATALIPSLLSGTSTVPEEHENTQDSKTPKSVYFTL